VPDVISEMAATGSTGDSSHDYGAGDDLLARSDEPRDIQATRRASQAR
jgi:hypothetical protein